MNVFARCQPLRLGLALAGMMLLPPAAVAHEGFSLRTHFGSGPVPDEATASIVLAGPAYAQIRSGELKPADAFLSGAIDIEGDMQKAMELALALMSGD